MHMKKWSSRREKLPRKPVKNYFILAVIIIATVLLVWYLCNWYDAYQDYQKTIPVIRGELPEITDAELDHYLLENEEILLYLCTASNEECRSFEGQLKKVVKKEKLENKMTYVNLSSVTNIDEFYREFNENHPYQEKLEKYPAIIYVEDGTVKNILQGSSGTLRIGEFQQFLDLNEVGEEE